MSLTRAQLASGCSEIEVLRPEDWLQKDGRRGSNPFAAELSDNGVATDGLKKAVTSDNVAVQDRNGESRQVAFAEESAELAESCEPAKSWLHNRMPSSGSLGTRSAPNLLHVAPYALCSMLSLATSLAMSLFCDAVKVSDKLSNCPILCQIGHVQPLPDLPQMQLGSR